jgi:uncharacterized protein (DUF427 family)
MKAIWNGTVIAESDHTVYFDNNHYFPAESLNKDCIAPSDQTSVCGWKGTANYYDVVVGADTNPTAAWYYANPLEAAEEIRDHVAFWRGVKVEE